MSSTAIGTFVSILKTLQLWDGDMVLIDLQPEVLEVYGISNFFNIHDSLDDAIISTSSENNKKSLDAFPVILKCPICSTKLKASKPGRYRCPECKTILAIDSSGRVYLEE
jgi:anti-sigma B factor antagonist